MLVCTLFCQTSLSLRASKIHFILSRSESLESFKATLLYSTRTANVNLYHVTKFLLTCALLFITSTPKLVASRFVFSNGFGLFFAARFLLRNSHLNLTFAVCLKRHSRVTDT